MLSARDSFLHFVHDNLVGVVVRNLRRDPDDASLSQLAIGVNIQFIGDDSEVAVSGLLTNIDVIDEKERDCITTVEKLSALLRLGGYTQLVDYTTLSPAGGNVFWDVNAIRFRPVSDDLFFRYSCTLRLEYQTGTNSTLS